jgi:phosphate starvation-inducible PhoH-like protein
VSGEQIFEIEGSNPVEFFGVNNANMKLVEEAFPQLKIVVRGHEIKANGTDEQLLQFENVISYFQKVFDRFGVVKLSDVKQLLNSTEEENRNYVESEKDNKVLVHGRNGRLIRARTKNQKRMVESMANNDMLFAIGPAGTGKTYTAVALAVRALKNKEVRRIILTRPAVEAGENLGFLPGDLRDKLDPYLQPLYDALRDMIPQTKLMTYFEDGTIEIAPWLLCVDAHWTMLL